MTKVRDFVQFGRGNYSAPGSLVYRYMHTARASTVSIVASDIRQPIAEHQGAPVIGFGRFATIAFVNLACSICRPTTTTCNYSWTLS